MAWLKGLAGKAEDFLNQIDQNAAVALQKDRKDTSLSDSILTEVKWDEQHNEGETVGNTGEKLQARFKPASAWPGNSPVRSSPSVAVQNKKARNDEELINFLNGSEPLIGASAKEQHSRMDVPINKMNGIAHETFTPIVVELEQQETQRTSSQRSSCRASPQNEQPRIITPVMDEDLRTENTLLKNELRTLNSEVSQLLQRCKSAEKENWALQKHITSLQASHVQHLQTVKEKESEISALQKELQQAADVGIKLDGIQVKNEKLLQSNSEQSHNLQEQLEREENLRAAHQKEISSLQTRLSKLESEQASQLDDVEQRLKEAQEAKLELQQQWERVRVELDEARSQLDQYRTRAQRILQDKEKLIAELRGQGSAERSTAVDDTMELELQQLQQERELLREEVLQVSARLQASREELQEMERRLEAGREQASHSIQLLQDNLQEERKKKQAAEEDCRTHSEELRSVREELSRQRAQLAARVREREAELTRLRTQLTQRPTSPPGTDELESRLHLLTQTLVQKQASLETVTTEKNALRLQLEKIQNKHRDTLALLHQLQTGVVNMNDTDDAKARVPSFLLESPFDTGMTLRVKRAYSSLDAISIRTGVFLRRYPLARILVMWYMVLLHLWVMLVLFSSTPQPQM